MESEDGDALRFGLEDTGELLLDGGLGDVCLIWVDQLDLHLLSGKKWVLDHFLCVEDKFAGHGKNLILK